MTRGIPVALVGGRNTGKTLLQEEYARRLAPAVVTKPPEKPKPDAPLKVGDHVRSVQTGHVGTIVADADRQIVRARKDGETVPDWVPQREHLRKVPEQEFKVGDAVSIFQGPNRELSGVVHEVGHHFFMLKSEVGFKTVAIGDARKLPEQEFSVGSHFRLGWESGWGNIVHLENRAGLLAEVVEPHSPTLVPPDHVVVEYRGPGDAKPVRNRWPKRLLTRIDFCEKVKEECSPGCAKCPRTAGPTPPLCPHHPRYKKG